MRFEVPQFIEIEDKIFGPLSWRQFLYLGGGLGMAVTLFLVSKLLFLFIGIPLAILAGALAFYPVNNRPFSFFLEAIFTYVSSQRLYLWRQQSDIVHRGATESPDGANPYQKPSNIPTQGTKTNKNITSLARRLELQALQKPNQ
jgi:hypothetical protein